MRKLNHYLIEYNHSHQNPINQMIHSVCVPLIFWSTLAILYVIPIPGLNTTHPLNFAYVAIVIGILFYLSLGIVPLLIMVTQIAISIMLINLINNNSNLLLAIALPIFIICWIAQFFGHKIEGKKPSFVDDLKFLLIGPLWVTYKLFKYQIRQ